MSAKNKAGRPLDLAAAEQAFAALPENFRRSAVGMSLARIVELLEENGEVPLTIVLAALYPGEDLKRARTHLQTQIVNRPWRDADGRTPLLATVSRAPRLLDVADQCAAQRVRFLGEAAGYVPRLTGGSRYAPQAFEEGMAREATGAQLLAAANKPPSAPIPPVPSTEFAGESEDLRTARQQRALQGIDKTALNQGRPTSRHSVTPEGFQEGPAQASNGFAAVGEEVKCLTAMLEWAGQPSSLPLLALLGDYGTGKTSHAMQFFRVLAGEVEHDAWPRTGKDLPQALFIDLATLAGIDNLARLTLEDLLRLALGKQDGRRLADDAAAEARLVRGLIESARRGATVMIYDGLDELLKNDRSVLHGVFEQLLKVLEPAADGEPSRARVLVSCRTHYFRDIENQHAFFDTRRRGLAAKGDYLCLTLLPWARENIDRYLARAVPDTGQRARLLEWIGAATQMRDLAAHPILLALMSEHIGELLRRQEAAGVAGAGAPMGAADLYGIVVAEWLQRDQGKHSIRPEHKPLVMGALAAAQWNEGVEQWPADRLDAWLPELLAALWPDQYAAVAPAALQDDLRTATFIVRVDERRFNFAHRSFLEYFLARFVRDLAAHCAFHPGDDRLRAAAYALLPQRDFNGVALDFWQALWRARPAEAADPQLAQTLAVLWGWLQTADKERIDAPAPASHGVLFDLLAGLGLPASTNPLSHKVAANLAPQPFNLRSAQLIEREWRDLDLSAWPPLDLRSANCLGLHAYDCRFGEVRCNARTNFGQSVLRRCTTERFAWNGADRGGMRLRGPHRPPAGALRGPWTQPVGAMGWVTSVAIAPDGLTLLTGSGDGTARLWDAKTGAELRRLQGHGKGVTSVAIAPDGLTLLTGSYDGTARLWHMDSHCRILAAAGWRGTATTALFDADGNLLGCDEAAADSWLFTLAHGRPEPLELAPTVD